MQVVVGAGDHTERIFNGAVCHSRQSKGNSGQQRPWAMGILVPRIRALTEDSQGDVALQRPDVDLASLYV